MMRLQKPTRSWVCCAVLAGLLASLVLAGQDPGPRPSWPQAHSKILLLGTFHFRDAGLDDYKPEHSVDILSEQRQKEIEGLVERLADFKPTKVAIELRQSRQEQVDRDYQAYLRGDFELSASEDHQIGFRLARRMGHSKVFLVDAPGRSYEPWVDPEKWAKEHNQQYLLDRAAPLWETFERIARWGDQAKVYESLQETLLRINDPERIRQSHGVYMIGNLAVGDSQNYPGADAKTRWFNRNLRIFANLMRITEQPGERIFLIIGGGHLPILSHCVEASPEYELVPATQYLRTARSEGPTLERVLQANSYRIDEEGELGGPGLDYLLKQAAQAQFVVLGEPHNVKQVPQFTTALFKALHSHYGFDYLALEQGPFIIEAMSLAGREKGREGVIEVASEYPEALHFYTDQELHMIADVSAIEGGRIPRVWGVDRSLSSVLALRQLSESASDQDLAAKLSSLSRQAREFNLSHLLERDRLMGSKPELFESLPGQAEGEDEEVRWKVGWLASSARNIRLFKEHTRENPSGYFSNLEREEMMKDAFLRQYRQAQAAGDSLPKVLFKSGHWHSLNGRNHGVLTLGNLAAQAARFNGYQSLQIHISVINEPGRHWSISDHEEWASLAAVASPRRWTLIDLRPLRGYLHSGLFKLAPQLKEMAFAFDMALVLGGTDPGSIEWAQALIQAAQDKGQPQGSH